jgi:N-acetylglutamate synthase-like GNAT family acetyltransferase
MWQDRTMATTRDYAPGDLRACRALWVELTEHHRALYDAPEIGGDDPGAQFDAHLDKVGPANLWVAEDDGAVVGLIGLMPTDEGDLEIEPIVVTRDRRGGGIGRRLVETVIAAAAERGIERVTVVPVARNSATLQFFHHLGFDIAGYVELIHDTRSDRWRPGLEAGGVTFRV